MKIEKRRTINLFIIMLFLLICFTACKTEIGIHQTRDTILRIGIISELDTTDLYNSLSDLVSICPAAYALRDQLMTFDPITLKPRPLLAEKVEKTDPSTFKVFLRKGVQWHDGVEFTAKDIAFTYNLLKEFKVPKFVSIVSELETVKVLDNHTVEFIFKIPTQTLPFGIDILPEHIWGPIKDQAKKTKNPLAYLLDYRMNIPIGTGPFQYADDVKGHSITLKANRAYFLKKPEIDGIIISLFKNFDEAFTAFQAGKIDFIDHTIEPEYIKMLENKKNFTIRRNANNELHFLAFNVRKKPFDDINLRKAVAFLIDKEKISKELLPGYGKPLYSVIPPGFADWHYPGVIKYGENLDIKQRIEMVKNNLTKAGYIQKDNKLYMPDSDLIKPVYLLTPSEEYDPVRARIGRIIADQMKDIGIELIPEEFSLPQITSRITGNDFDMYILGWHLPLNLSYISTFFHSMNAVKGGYNTTGYKNPGLDKLIKEIENKKLSLENQKAVVNEIQKIIANDIPVIPLYYTEKVEAYRNNRFEGWVDMVGGIVNIWSFRNLYPVK